jgi:hypothetical protein
VKSIFIGTGGVFIGYAWAGGDVHDLMTSILRGFESALSVVHRLLS